MAIKSKSVDSSSNLQDTTIEIKNDNPAEQHDGDFSKNLANMQLDTYHDRPKKRDKNEYSYQASELTYDSYRSIFHSANLFSRD